MNRAIGVSILVAFFTCAALNAQAPHGGQTTTPQPGPNVNAVGGIADPKDPAALVKADLNLQRQNETVVAASTRNPDHILAAANDYRFVDFPQDQYYGGAQNFFTRLIARLFGRPGQRLPPRAAAAVGAWTGLYRSCDRGRTWIGSALPGSPLDFSGASMSSPLKRLSERAELQGGHAETTDPVMVAGPGGRMHLVVLGFVRFPNGSVGDSRMFYASYTDRNNLEGGSCFSYDFMQEIDTGAAYTTLTSPTPFIDKPAVAVDKDGTLYAAYTVFADTVKSKIVVARSTNGGGTWTKTIPLLNLGFLRNHGTALTIDPLDGTVYVAWRMFYDNWPLMVISKSYDKGRTFFPATPISNFWPSRNLQQIIDQLKAAKLQPFDQFSPAPGDPPAARALAFPSIVAGVVNGKSKLVAAWTERADVDPRSPTWGLPSASGSPRIMISISSDGGWSWTARRAIDAGPRTENLDQPGVGALVARPSGPQLQPVLSMSGTTNAQLLVMYYEARSELDAPYATSFISGIERMMDVRTARVDPVTGTLLAPSVQVSQYPVRTNSSPAELPEIAPGYRMANRHNLTMYAGGTTAFIGDYPGLAPSQPFEFKSGRWTWSSDPGPTLAMWTDNRDVAFPLDAHGKADINGAWTNYQPLVPTDPLAPAATDCSFVASRNSNPYFSEIGGVVAGAPQSFKPLTIQRAFATYVENRTPQDRFFRLTIEDNERQGIDGSFDQFDFGAAADVRNVKIFANSSHHRTIWVQPRPEGPAASLSMLVQETVTLGGALKADGYRTRVVLNPDPNNDALTTVPPEAAQYAGNPAITADSSELHNPQISSPQISTFRVSAPQISSPQISSPQISTPQISSPQISTPQISTPQISSPQISTPQISTAPPDEQNGTDVTYTVRNEGTTWTTYDALFNVPEAVQLIGSGNYQFQVLITRTSLVPAFVQTANGCSAAARQDVHVLANIPVPQISSPQISTISNPQISSPQISSPQIATFSLAPAGGATVQQADGSDPDSHSVTIPDQVQVTVRAIALKPRAEILASGGTLFNPATVEAKVTSSSTNVVQGIVEAPGTQPAVVTRPDLIVASAAVPAGLSVPAGGAVSLGPVVVKNQGSQATGSDEGGTSVGYYVSADPVITEQDTLLASDTVFALPIGGEVTLEGRTLTIPVTTAPGVYYIGVLVDRLNVVVESDEGNNASSAPITVTAAQLLDFVTQPSDATARQAIVPAVQVAARDATGAGLPGVSVTLMLSANATGASLAGATGVTNAVGVATFPALAVSQAGSGYTLQANAATQSSAPSFPFNITGAGALVCGEAAFDTSQLAAHRVQPDPQFVAVGDFNRDGRRDVVTANVGSNDVSVLLADASGGFGDPTNYLVGGSPAGLAIGDFNRDGFPDIAVARSNAPTVVVLSGNATGGFGAATSYPVGNLAGVLTAADVNEDGRLDLVIAAAEAGDGTGRLTLLAGTAAGGFSAPVGVAAGGPSSLPAAIATTDLNGDGHVDVVVSNHGEDNVSVFLGDGAGGFAPRVTYADGGGALAVGDFTSDGHPDVAVVQSHGTTVSFLRGSASGTLTPGTPLTLAAEGRAIVAADIDGDGTLDLAAVQAEGFSTFLGNGDGAFGFERPVDPNSEPRALAVADFTNDGKADFVVANGAPADAVTFLTNVCVAGPRQLIVTNTNDAGVGSLRSALEIAQANAGFADTVIFRIPGSGVHAIALQSALPAISDPIVIDGSTQPGYAGMPLVELTETSTGGLANGLTLIAGGSTVHALIINGFTAAGIFIEGRGGNSIQGNFIGTDATGTIARPNLGGGVLIVNSTNNIVGGTGAADRNIVSGNTKSGIGLLTGASGNTIQGNLIGTDVSGTVAIANQENGVFVESSTNTIGGTASGARNVISGNALSGVQINPGANSTIVQGNFIGLDVTGSRALGNGTQGVRSDGSDNGIIGGAAAGAGNVISGNQNGILITGAGDVAASGNRVEGNFIGTNAAGAAAIGNIVDGIIINDGTNNHVGGTTAAHGNVISGNTRVGVLIQGALSTGNRVEGNNISFNGRLGIDLEGFGVTANDSGDGDQGPNDLQNYPVLASAEALGSTHVRGSLTSTPNSTFTLEVFRSAACDASGFGEGETSLGTVAVTTDGTGLVTFDANLGAPITAGDFITATATNQATGSTSEFSNCIQATANDPFVVSSTNDDGPGTLRAAILRANDAPGPQEIRFNLAGPGPHRINLVSGLPPITDPLFVNGAAQPGYAGVPLVEVRGPATPVVTGLSLSAANSRIHALSLIGFGTAIALSFGGNDIVDGNYIGLAADGTVVPNGLGVFITSGGNQLGGPTAAERNVISGNTQRGIEIRDAAATGNRILNNYVGTSPDGLAARPNAIAGILVMGASSNTIGEPGAGNLISGNVRGVSIGPGATNNTVAANRIGTTATGAAALPNTELGIAVFGDTNTIGGTNAGDGNVISGNGAGGILITRALGGTGNGNFIYGNIVGLAADRSTPLANTGAGVSIQGGASNTIGGVTAESRNVIASNSGNGLEIAGASATGNVIAGNYIGVDGSGTGARPNTQAGVRIENAPNNRVGTIGAGNLISGNAQNGVVIQGSSGTIISANRIGTNAGGTAAIPNGVINAFGDRTGAGIVLVQSPSNSIGIAAAGGGNLISGNGTGVSVTDAASANTVIQGNLIGTDAAGTAAMPNRFGVFISGPNAIVGGTQVAARNVISGNRLEGIAVSGAAATGVTIQGNYIGTDVTGSQDVGNTFQGITVRFGAAVTIGGDRSLGAGNVIAGNNLEGILLETDGNTVAGNNIGIGPAGELTVGNAQSGIHVTGSRNVIGGAGGLYNIVGMNGSAGIDVSGVQNDIQQNVVFRNGGLGIDLGNDGVTPNDAGDADESANQHQNFPVLTTVTAFSAATRIIGTLNSTASNTFTLRFYANDACDSSGHGEGQHILGPATVLTDAAGNAPIDVTLPVTVAPGQVVTATATDSFGNTSEFSPCQQTTEWSAFLPLGTAAEATTTNPRSGNGSLELVAERSNPVYTNEPGGAFGTFGQLNALAFDWAIDPASQGQLPPDLALRVYPADDPRTFFLHWDTCSAVVLCSPRAKGAWQTTSLIGQLSIEPDFSRDNTPPASLADIPADAPIAGIHIRGNYSFGLPSFAYVDNVTIGFTGAQPKVFNFELAKPEASRHRPSIEWTRPAAIADGTALSFSELNATATAPGTFTYDPTAGTTLPPDLHELFVRFEPGDASLFLPVSRLVPLTVTGLATVLPDDPLWFTYLPTPGSFAAITTANPRSGNASLELSKVTGSGSAYIHEFRGIDFGSVSELTALSMDWFIDPVSEGARPPQLALRVYEYGDPRSFFLFWDTCSEVTPCDPHPTGSWQSTNLIGKLRIQSADGNPAPASLAEVPPDAPITGIHIRADFGFGGFWHGFADNLAIGFADREPVVFNFDRFGILLP